MNSFEPIPPEDELFAKAVVDAAFQVHQALGPGLMESVYEACLCHELAQRGIPFACQMALPLTYRGMRIEAGLRLDLLVGDRVVVELKAVEQVERIHKAQLLTYLRLSNRRLGLLINFNVTRIRDGVTRMVL